MSRRAAPAPVLRMEALRLSPEGALCRVLDDAGPGGASDRLFLVAGLVPGEVAQVRLGRRPGQARVLQIERPHPGRRAPACARYADPPACLLAGIALEHQASLKEGMLDAALASAGVPARPVEYGGAAPELEAGLQRALAAEAPELQRLPLRRAAPEAYRAKVVLAASQGPQGVRLGYFAPGSQDLRPGCSCPLHRPEIEPQALALEAELRRLGLGAASEDAAGLRFVTLRAGAEAEGRTGVWALLTFSATVAAATLSELGRRLVVPGGLASLWVSVQGDNANAVVGEEPQLVAQRAELWQQTGAVRIPLRPGAFHQGNPDGAALLVRAVLAAARDLGCERGRALDLYCGAGAYALNLAAAGWQVTAVEREGVALAAGRLAAEAAGLELDWRCADAAAWARAADAIAAPELVVLNPPRRGAAPELLAAVVALGPRRIVYVSCHPDTLARDLHLLEGLGRRARLLQPVDLFPQTGHLETVAVCD